MKEIFYEESAKTRNPQVAKTKYTVFQALSIFSIVVICVWVYVLFVAFEFGTGNIIVNIIVALIPIVVFLSSALVFGRLKNRFYVDYDYTLITGSIRISKIIKETKRYAVISFECNQIEKIGKFGSPTFERYEKMPDVSKLILTPNDKAEENKEFYYIVANTEGKKLMILECTETFIANVLQYSNRLVLEEEFK